MKKTNTNARTAQKTRLIAGCGVLSAAAIVLQYIEIAIPIMPSFIKLDVSDLPALIGAFAYGPVAGVIIELVKNLIHLAVSQSGYIGELSNFMLGAVFTLAAGLIYKYKQTKVGALLGGIAGAVLMAAVSYPSNLFVVYPFYYHFLPKDAVLEMYQAILPAVKNVEQALLVFNVPFTFVKGMLSVGVSMLIYKPLSPILHGRKS